MVLSTVVILLLGIIAFLIGLLTTGRVRLAGFFLLALIGVSVSNLIPQFQFQLELFFNSEFWLQFKDFLQSPAIIPLVITILAITYFRNSVKVIRQGSEALVERLGRYHRKLTPGLHFITPVLDELVLEESTRERVLDTGTQKAITKDNVPLELDAVIYWRILELERTYYAVEDVEEALANLTTTALRSQVGSMTLGETLRFRNAVNQALLPILDEATAVWGIKVTRVEVQEILPSPEILRGMELEQESESRRRAAILEAEGKKRATIEEVEGLVQAIKLLTEQSGQLKPKAIDPEVLLQYFAAMRYIEASYKLGESTNAKIVFMSPKTLEEMSDIIHPVLTSLLNNDEP